MMLFICDLLVTPSTRLDAKSDNARMPATIDEPRAQPESLTDLFVSFTVLALQGFGGEIGRAHV